MAEQNRPTSERSTFRLTQNALGKSIPKSLVLTVGMKARILHVLLELPAACSILCSSTGPNECQSQIGYLIIFV